MVSGVPNLSRGRLSSLLSLRPRVRIDHLGADNPALHIMVDLASRFAYTRNRQPPPAKKPQEPDRGFRRVADTTGHGQTQKTKVIVHAFYDQAHVSLYRTYGEELAEPAPISRPARPPRKVRTDSGRLLQPVHTA